MRFALHQNPDSLIIYVVLDLFTTLAPCGFIAAEYMILGRLTTWVKGERYLMIRPSRLTKVFVASDVTTFLIQVRVYPTCSATQQALTVMINTRRQAEVYQRKRVVIQTRPSSAQMYVPILSTLPSPRRSLTLPPRTRSSSLVLSSNSSPSHSSPSYFSYSFSVCAQTNPKRGHKTKCTVSPGNATGAHSSSPCFSAASVFSYVFTYFPPRQPH